MGKILMPGGGGGGVSSDELTALLSNVLEGKTVMAADSNDEIGVGTLPKSKVLSDAGGDIETKTDFGNVTLTATNATKSYPAGYYPNDHGATVPVYTYS